MKRLSWDNDSTAPWDQDAEGEQGGWGGWGGQMIGDENITGDMREGDGWDVKEWVGRRQDSR